jgi:hypothetical protein
MSKLLLKEIGLYGGQVIGKMTVQFRAGDDAGCGCPRVVARCNYCQRTHNFALRRILSGAACPCNLAVEHFNPDKVPPYFEAAEPEEYAEPSQVR